MKKLLLLLPLLLTGCSVLKPVKDTSISHILDPTISDRRLTASTPSIAIARPSLPSYLDREQLVARSQKGQLQMNPYHIWAEPLDAAFSRVLSQNLSRLTGSLNIQPVENYVTMDYTTLLEIRVVQFEPDASGYVTLNCTWKLQPVHGRVASTRSFRTQISSGPDDATLSSRTAAMNEALARLAREIARSL
jgi:uncharacterized lipoprotein YmbA